MERGREGQVEDIICDGNYKVGAYYMEWAHDRKPDRTIKLTMTHSFNIS